ncbi:flagellar basal body P-ring formation chaperone FlgA [Histidinibacterium aquaticum]|uniref:Flagella basal body P-ring formation protein FlgA n=1 Tax=Histidinibacterium aquaticum TaxID=2613962 RepID=A0A5J5GPJ0_9RHOB|nr:flagellar basal body P-ring formation chaperone FlgA [Histidinibacterium aquaticum]KAA9009975.1 flagellar basal body P-ring formation protein FlgA [Histidinibacterium aquaticum]
MRALILISCLLAGPSFAEDLDVLVEERARGQLGATLPAEAEFEISLRESDVTDVLMLAEFWMDSSTGQFAANAVLPTGETRRVIGVAVATVPVPVPVRRLLPDELIGPGDLHTVRLPLGRVGAFAVTDADALVGMQVRRVLSQGRPIMTQSVIEPLVIERGDDVSIRYEDGVLALSAPGRALSGAHRGQDIRVVNLVSNKPVTGVAQTDGIVEVRR